MLKNKISHFQISCFLVSVMLLIACIWFGCVAERTVYQNNVILTANELREAEYSEISGWRDPEMSVKEYYYAVYVYYENGYKYTGGSEIFNKREDAEMLLGTTVEILIDGKGGSTIVGRELSSPVPFIIVSVISGIIVICLITLIVLDGIKRHKGLFEIRDLFRKKEDRFYDK